MLDSDLKSKINQLWDKFWSGGISNPLQAIEQMSYLLFMKQLEDEDNSREQNSRLNKKDFKSLFEGCPDCKWSVWTNYPSEKILDHVRDKVFPFMRNLGGDDSLYAKYMKDSVFAIPTPSLLVEAVKIINGMHIKEQNRDTKGDLYEYLLSELTTSGKNGQFRTPRHIIKMMVELVDPKIGDIICDPACGTAGFLINAYNYILRENTSEDFIKQDDEGNEYNFKGDKLDDEDWKLLKDKTLHGYDFDRTMTRISLMNLMMHGIIEPNIEQLNTLSTRYEEDKSYDVVLANPPFKGSIDKAEINENFTIKTTKTEILFLELMYNILVSGGRCAVIVPQGVLFGNSKAHKGIRKKLLEDCRLDAVISMPSGVFKPYAGVSTGILVFTKGEPTKKVWFYDMEADGYSLDDKRNFIDGKGDIPDIVEKFKNRENEDLQDRKAKCFFVPFEEIKENDYGLSISNYKEIEYEEVEYEAPEVIKGKILELEEKIVQGLKELDI
ncbi:type I restriction-modification system subunit M [Methanobacterium paludis]|uniref:site-specific DNA-methyltransferase (adenine-specific) n=1 Tax=Methanobacterium paludis (strain DSM 25820 / JCM 18151 / SWAN1) TaxID=868131 RepID=F6D6M3_METPW|nr:type I restriction-modification system subunit M [Methanobacterium paludis]AEG17736.1 N-6 DNA methylase [Methanobacterium paludis]